MTDDRYARIYWTVMDDPKFDGIREDARLFGSWSLCLVMADMAWPASAYVPPTVPRSAFRRLADCGLLDELPGHRFRVHGMDKERERRSQSASHAASTRWRNAPRNADGNAPRNAESMPSQAEQIREEQSTPATRAPDPGDVYWTLTGRYPTDKVLGWVDDLSASYGPEAVIRALATTHRDDPHTNTLLGRTQDNLRAEARALDLKEQATVRASLKEQRAQPRVERDEAAIRAEVQRLMQPGAAA